MNTSIHRCLVAWAALLTTALAVADEPQPQPVKEPSIPAELAAKGVAYHTISGRQAQVTFTSKAPLENIVGKSNAIVGYAVSGPADSPAELAGAQWLLPIESLATGIPLRDEHLASEEWLDAETCPIISFTLKATENAKLIKKGDGFSTWSVTLIGDLAMHGETRSLRIDDARISFVKETPKTQRIAKGDLLFLKCSYAVSMSDFGIRHKDVPEKVSDVIELQQMLRLSTEPQSPEPAIGTGENQDTNAVAGGRGRP